MSDLWGLRNVNWFWAIGLEQMLHSLPLSSGLEWWWPQRPPWYIDWHTCVPILLFLLSTFWSWQQSMREGYEGLFIVSWLGKHYTVIVGYTAVLCPSVKYTLCYLEHSWIISWTGDQVLLHSNPSLAMRRNLSWIYCVQLSQFDLEFGVKVIWNCWNECVWSDPVSEGWC